MSCKLSYFFLNRKVLGSVYRSLDLILFIFLLQNILKIQFDIEIVVYSKIFEEF